MDNNVGGMDEIEAKMDTGEDDAVWGSFTDVNMFSPQVVPLTNLALDETAASLKLLVTRVYNKAAYFSTSSEHFISQEEYDEVVRGLEAYRAHSQHLTYNVRTKMLPSIYGTSIEKEENARLRLTDPVAFEDKQKKTRDCLLTALRDQRTNTILHGFTKVYQIKCICMLSRKTAMVTIWNQESQKFPFQVGSIYFFNNVRATSIHQENNEKYFQLAIESPSSVFATTEHFDDAQKSFISDIVTATTRKYTGFFEIKNYLNIDTVHNEFDTVGLVADIGNFGEHSGQNVIIMDISGTRITVKFYSSIKKLGVGSILKHGAVIACQHLRIRKISCKRNNMVFYTHRTIFTNQLTNVPEHMVKHFQQLTLAIENSTFMKIQAKRTETDEDYGHLSKKRREF